MVKDFRDDPGFWQFEEEHYQDIDHTIKSMYLSWRKAVESGHIPVFAIPQVDDEGLSEEFIIEVLEKVDGAGIIRSREGRVVDEQFVWRLNSDGYIEVAVKSSEVSPDIPNDVHAACTGLVEEYYEGRQVSVNERVRDFYFALNTGKQI